MVKLTKAEKKLRHDTIRKHWPDTEKIRQTFKDQRYRITDSTIFGVASELKLRGAHQKAWANSYARYEKTIEEYAPDLDKIRQKLGARGHLVSDSTIKTAISHINQRNLLKAGELLEKIEKGENLDKDELQHKESVLIAASEHAMNLHEKGDRWLDIVKRLKKVGLTDEHLLEVRRRLTEVARQKQP